MPNSNGRLPLSSSATDVAQVDARTTLGEMFIAPTSTNATRASERSSKPAQPVVLRVERLNKHFGTTDAVAGLTFAIHEGEVLGLLGPNGAGKTTAVSLLATRLRPSGGDAALFGHSLYMDPKRARGMIGFAPQDTAVYPMLTAAENLRFFGRIYGLAGTELESRIAELLDFVGLEARRDDFVATFSGGMKRRISLAAALVHRPRLLLLDEPGAGLDPQSRERIFRIVRELRNAGNAILYTTHYMEEAERLCDRIAIMSHGTIVALGTLDELLGGLEYPEIIELHGLVPEVVRAALKTMGDSYHIESRDEVTRLFVRNASHFLKPLEQMISRSRKPVHVKIARKSLGDLFLDLTGEEMGD